LFCGNGSADLEKGLFNHKALPCMTSDYLQRLARLRTDANRSRWTEATAHCAPHESLFFSFFWKPTSDIRGV